MITKLLSAIALTLLLGAAQTHATQTVRELFDNLGVDGHGVDGCTNDFTSVGLSTGYWTNSPTGQTGIAYKGTFTVNWVLQALQGNILPDSGTGANGCIDSYTGNLNTLTNPATSLPYGALSPLEYATHPLDPSAYIDCNAAGTYYFSVRIEKSYSWSVGDSSAGLGVSTGNGTNDHFIAIGVTRPATVDTNNNDIGDTDYVTYGTLGQPGIAGQDDTGGPYLPVATGAAQLYNSGPGAVNWAETGFVIGKLVTSPGGACTLSVFTMLPNATLISNEVDVVWDATTNFTETNMMTQLLMFMHGTNVEYDAIRVGTTYQDVVGLETIGAPVASPGADEYAGTVVTLAGNAQVNSAMFPMTYQWLSNGVPWDLTQTNATLVLTNTTVGMSADYSMIANNYYGSVTTAVTHVTFLPATPFFFTAQPKSITRYVGSPAGETFTVGGNGSPPFNYQWKHAGTNYVLHTSSSLSDTLTIPGPTTVADGGDYYVTGANSYGSPTDSATATNTVLVPSAGSYAAAVLALNPWGYWRLDDNVRVAGDTNIYDNWGNNNGNVEDASIPTYQTNAAPYPGFPNPHYGIGINNDGSHACRVDLAMLPVWSNQMTLTFWVNKGAAQMVSVNGYGNGYGVDVSNVGGSNELFFNWNSFGPAYNGGMDTGIAVPTNGWSFVAVVVSPDHADFYVGNDTSNLVSATLAGLSLQDSTTAGDTAGLFAPGLGRVQYPWSEGGSGSPALTLSGTWSDVAIYYQSLTVDQIDRLYAAGAGAWITGTPAGAGNLSLNWLSGLTLQEADSVTGPWTDVSGSPTPPYSVPISTTTSQHYYRVR